MNFSLKPKKDLLKYLLGNIDFIDVSYTLNSTHNTLILCLTDSMLDILYKYDPTYSNYENDQTDSGYNECLNANVEFINDTIIKFSITQKFVRCFSTYKELIKLNNNYNIDKSFISLYPKSFLDFDNDNLKMILSKLDIEKLQSSSSINFEFTELNKYQIPNINKVASRGKKLPDNIELLSFIDNNLSYSKEKYTLKDSITNENIDINVQYDSNAEKDKYSSYAKSFNVINDSTIILNFEIYLNVKKNNYLIDTNDINVNYHISPIDDNITTDSISTIKIYEKINNYFNINDIIYIKDIYTDSIMYIGKILNINNNSLITLKVQSIESSLTFNFMDKYTLNKIRNLENFNTIQQRNNLLSKLIKNDLFTINDINFDEKDYLSINNFNNNDII